MKLFRIQTVEVISPPTAVVNTVGHSQIETCAPLGQINPKGERIIFHSQIYNGYHGPIDHKLHHSAADRL